MLISPSLMFIHYPRTGGSSIQKLVLEALPGKYYPIDDERMNDGQKAWVVHQGLDVAWQYARHLGLDPEAIPALVVIRNPYDLMISGYKYLGQRWKGQVADLPNSFRAYLEDLSARTPPDRAQAWARAHYGQYDDYLRLGGRQPSNLTVARFENLVEEVGAFLVKAGMDPAAAFPHRNATEHQHFSRYYTGVEEELVYRMWKNAFDNGLYARHEGLG